MEEETGVVKLRAGNAKDCWELSDARKASSLEPSGGVWPWQRLNFGLLAFKI